MQRLTKYPILISPISKDATNGAEKQQLEWIVSLASTYTHGLLLVMVRGIANLLIESVSESVGRMVTHESVLKHLVFKRVILRSKSRRETWTLYLLDGDNKDGDYSWTYLFCA